MSIHALSSATLHRSPTLIKGADPRTLAGLALKVALAVAATFVSVTLFGVTATVIIVVSLAALLAGKELLSSSHPHWVAPLRKAEKRFHTFWAHMQKTPGQGLQPKKTTHYETRFGQTVPGSAQPTFSYPPSTGQGVVLSTGQTIPGSAQTTSPSAGRGSGTADSTGRKGPGSALVEEKGTGTFNLHGQKAPGSGL